MDLKLHIYGALCSTSEFTVNGIQCEESDFGEKYDRDCESAQPYGCGDMQFTRIEPKQEILKKYGINEQEFSEICDKLESGLSFGCCGWCV